MKPEEAHEIRRLRWEKFKEHYVPHVIQAEINRALSERYKGLTFPVDNDDWVMVTWVPIFYYHYGFEQKDDVELPAYVEATSRFHKGSNAIGSRVTMRIMPPKTNGGDYMFPGLGQLINDALSNREAVADGAFKVTDIMADESAPPTFDETAEMVDRMVGCLVEMGFSRRGAVKAAQETIAANPEISSIDGLLDIAVENN